MAGFGGLSVALSGLYASQRALDVAGQNIANANTEGYTRQRVTMKALGVPSVPSIFATAPAGSLGGVQVSAIERLRDSFLEVRAQDGHAALQDMLTGSSALGAIEQLFPEPGDDGLASQLSAMWSAFHDVANQPNDVSVRSSLIQRASVVSDWLNETAGALAVQSRDLTEAAGSLVTEINTTAAQLADLNLAVLRSAQAGMPANELADQRDQLALKLAELAGGTTQKDSDGNINVRYGGGLLVSGSSSENLQVSSTAGVLQIQWQRTGNAATPASGQLRAVAEAVNVTIPTWSGRLDAVASTMATQVNALHTAGYDLDGHAGAAFFSGTTAATIRVAVTDPRGIAASSVAPVGGVASLDASNATAMAALGSSVSSPDAAYRRLIADLGVAGQTATRRTDTQTTIVGNLDAAIESESGVSLDDEMTSLVTYKRSYEAAARLMTAVDEMLDILINKTGLVGR